MQELLAPNLWPDEHWREPSQRLARISSAEQRRVAVAAADLALTQNGLQGEVSDVTDALSDGRFAGPAHREAVRLLAERLDEAYFDAQEAGDGATSLREFRRARAASALLAALDPDPRAAARDAIYESLHSLPSEERLLALLRRELKL